MDVSEVISREVKWESISYYVVHRVYWILAFRSSALSLSDFTLSTILPLIYSFSVFVEVDLIWSKAASSYHIVLGGNSPYSLVDSLTSLNDNLFSGTKVNDNYNTP